MYLKEFLSYSTLFVVFHSTWNIIEVKLNFMIIFHFKNVFHYLTSSLIRRFSSWSTQRQHTSTHDTLSNVFAKWETKQKKKGSKFYHNKNNNKKSEAKNKENWEKETLAILHDIDCHDVTCILNTQPWIASITDDSLYEFVTWLRYGRFYESISNANNNNYNSNILQFALLCCYFFSFLKLTAHLCYLSELLTDWLCD